MTGHSDLNFPVLIGDIGGTNARFQIIKEKGSTPINFDSVRTNDFHNIDKALTDFVLKKSAVTPRSSILAAAGPITENGLNLTNCHWDLVPDQILSIGPIEQLILMNDFEAQALALPCLTSQDGVLLGGNSKTSSDEHTKAVLGPGTGLGVGILVWAGGKWIPVPGEGGHVDLGPRSERESAIWKNLVPLDGRISAEQAVSGAGLENLYRACCLTDSVVPAADNAAAISTRAMATEDDQAVDALSLFCTTLGRIAGDLALTSMSTGGVYIGGGIAQKILPFLKASQFRAAFEDKAPHSELMREIATIVVTHPVPALLGLAAYANAPDRYLLDIAHRHWLK
ncbi:MAG: glucokinase [Rhizobiaceae bacterium]